MSSNGFQDSCVNGQAIFETQAASRIECAAPSATILAMPFCVIEPRLRCPCFGVATRLQNAYYLATLPGKLLNRSAVPYGQNAGLRILFAREKAEPQMQPFMTRNNKRTLQNASVLLAGWLLIPMAGSLGAAPALQLGFEEPSSANESRRSAILTWNGEPGWLFTRFKAAATGGRCLDHRGAGFGEGRPAHPLECARSIEGCAIFSADAGAGDLRHRAWDDFDGWWHGLPTRPFTEHERAADGSGRWCCHPTCCTRAVCIVAWCRL